MDEMLEFTLKVTFIKTRPNETDDDARRYLVEQIYDIADVDNVDLVEVRRKDG